MACDASFSQSLYTLIWKFFGVLWAKILFLYEMYLFKSLFTWFIYNFCFQFYHQALIFKYQILQFTF